MSVREKLVTIAIKELEPILLERGIMVSQILTLMWNNSFDGKQRLEDMLVDAAQLHSCSKFDEFKNVKARQLASFVEDNNKNETAQEFCARHLYDLIDEIGKLVK